jgi:hypothetical protein
LGITFAGRSLIREMDFNRLGFIFIEKLLAVRSKETSVGISEDRKEEHVDKTKKQIIIPLRGFLVFKMPIINIM